ncbi:hypothetical protein Tco_1223398 [Tanacetum coccineum]
MFLLRVTDAPTCSPDVQTGIPSSTTTAGKKNNTNGPFGLGSDSGFPPLVDVTSTVHVQGGSVVSSPAVDEHVVAAGNP